MAKSPNLGPNLRRIIQGHIDKDVRDPLGLDVKLIEYFMSGKAFVFSKGARRLAMEILRSEDIRQTTRSDKFWHASSAGSCRRLQILHKRYPDVVRVDPLTAIQRMDDGKWGHLKWQLIFHEMGLLERCEYLVHYRPWNAGGSPDGELVLRYRDPETKFLLEIKRVSSYRFGNILRTGEPERPHILQTHTYIQATDLTNIVYLYENKDTNDWRIFWQKRDLDVIKYLRGYYEYLNDYDKRGKVPKPDCTFQRSDKMFLYCDMKKICIERLKKSGLWEKYDPAAT